MRRARIWVGMFIGCIAAVDARAALSVPFIEDFGSDEAKWRTALNAAPAYASNGGPSGASDPFISSTHTFTGTTTTAATIFRGQDTFDSSGDAFVGNWVAGGVRKFGFYIRHNASIDLTVGARFAQPANFPAVATTSAVKVAPNTWTLVEFAISVDNASLTYEAGDFASNFATIGNVQILAARETLPSGSVVTFDLDKVAITPEPGTAALLGAFALVATARRRNAAK